MVHGLETLKSENRLREKTLRRQKGLEAPKVKIPDSVAGNPARVRAYLNRPWTEKELSDRRGAHGSDQQSASLKDLYGVLKESHNAAYGSGQQSAETPFRTTNPLSEDAHK